MGVCGCAVTEAEAPISPPPLSSPPPLRKLLNPIKPSPAWSGPAAELAVVAVQESLSPVMLASD